MIACDRFIKDATVIIRSVGERTEDACVELLKHVFPQDNVTILRATPFSEAVRQSFRLAIERGLPWLVCVDADVLVDVDQLPKLILKALELEESVFQIQGLVLDKFVPIHRPAGNHVYRTSLLEKALQFIPEEGVSLRPESDMLNEMSRQGHPWVQCDVVVGIHDFEQYYADIYRTCFLHGVKHLSWLPHLEPYWNLRAPEDFDFELAAVASLSGRIYKGTVYVDKAFSAKEFEHIMALKSFTEKAGLSYRSLDDLTFIIRQAGHHHDAVLQDRIYPPHYLNALVDLQDRNDRGLHLKHMLNRFLQETGAALEALGRKVKGMKVS